MKKTNGSLIPTALTAALRSGRFSFEYQFRPTRTAVVEADPATGALAVVNPIRVNTALFALEFVC
jgi:hypothetical protein